MTELDNYKEDISKYQDLWDNAVQKNSNFTSSNLKTEEESVKIGLWGQVLEKSDDNFWDNVNVMNECVEQKGKTGNLVTFNEFLYSKERS